MTFKVHGFFKQTASPFTQVNFFTIPRQEDNDIESQYRRTEQPNSIGGQAVTIDKTPRDIPTEIIGAGNAFDVLKPLEGELGNLHIRGEDTTVRLLKVRRVRGLGPQTIAVVDKGGGALVITPGVYDFMMCSVEFLRET